jgi:hypothetical protein
MFDNKTGELYTIEDFMYYYYWYTCTWQEIKTKKKENAYTHVL